ncbi:MAG TPA: DUF167 domain-containing protein [Candidatus Gracilibacteria bacterium]|nr:DUF167 domain-containing protein [Candidatus Gracilibacteria bacterium]
MSLLADFQVFLDQQDKDFFYVRMRAVPNSPFTDITEHLSDDSWKIRVNASPEKQRANQEILRFLQKNFGNYEFDLVAGLIERIKILSVRRK